MAKQLSEISPALRAFIERQHVFFVGTAAQSGRVNVSPKGMDSLRVRGPNKVAWFNVTGSGNESAAHVLQLPRMTLMFCAFEGAPLILRLYGQARMVQPGDARWPAASAPFPVLPGARQVFELDVDLVQTSCGMAVPYLDFVEERGDLNAWAAAQPGGAMHAYRLEKNSRSLDGDPTGLPGARERGAAVLSDVDTQPSS